MKRIFSDNRNNLRNYYADREYWMIAEIEMPVI